MKPGTGFNVPHETAVRAMTEGLVDLGLLDGEVDELIANEGYQPVLRAQERALARPRRARRRRLSRRRRVAHAEPGMVLTVEPGIYIARRRLGAAKYRGIGIRIEDDVLVTRDGHEVLTAAAPNDQRDRGGDGVGAQVTESTMRRVYLLLVSSCFAGPVSAATKPVHYGLFGNVHVAAPAGVPKRTVVLISD